MNYVNYLWFEVYVVNNLNVNYVNDLNVNCVKWFKELKMGVINIL